MMQDPDFRGLAGVVRVMSSVLDELNLHDGIEYYRSEVMEIDDNLTISLPKDCINVMKVGVVGQDAKVRVMGNDDRIRRKGLADTNKCTCDDTTDDICTACTFCNVWWGNSYFGELYGAKSVEFANGSYRYDRPRNALEFGSGYDISAGAKILVEYKSALDGEGYNMIPSENAMAVAFRTIMALSASVAPGRAQYAEHQFKVSWAMLKRRKINNNPLDLIAAVKGQSMAAPKF
jgi:hypothetical protein